MNEKLDIITIGESLIELSTSSSLKTSECFSRNYGGDALVTAIAALRSGSNVGYITKVGNDTFGEYLLSAWKSEGLESSLVKLTKGQNGIYFVGHDNNSREYQYYRQKTAASTLGINDIDFDYIKKAKLIYTTGFVQSLSLSTKECIQEIFKFAKENGVLTSYDPNCQKYGTGRDEALENFNMISDYIDILFMETKDGEQLFETTSVNMLITKLSDLGIKTIVIKDKETGISIYENNDTINIPPILTEMIDATGVSNAFNGCFLSKYLDGANIINSGRFANALCLLQMQNVGAVKSIPYKKDVEEYCGKIYG